MTGRFEQPSATATSAGVAAHAASHSFAHKVAFAPFVDIVSYRSITAVIAPTVPSATLRPELPADKVASAVGERGGARAVPLVGNEPSTPHVRKRL